MFSLQLAQRWALEAMRHKQVRELRRLCLSVRQQQNTESLWVSKIAASAVLFPLLPPNECFHIYPSIRRFLIIKHWKNTDKARGNCN